MEVVGFEFLFREWREGERSGIGRSCSLVVVFAREGV